VLLESAFHYLFCLKFLFKLVTFSRVMQENKSGYFSEHSVVVRLCCILTVHLQLFLVMWLLCLCSLCCNGGRHPVFCPISRYFFRFTKYWTCFQEIYESNLYHQQIKCLHFGWNWNRIRQKIAIDVYQSCRDVKQLLMPSEWIHEFCSAHWGRCNQRHNFMLI